MINILASIAILICIVDLLIIFLVVIKDLFDR